jgi:hypothetical protein
MNVVSIVNDNEMQTTNYFEASNGVNPFLNPLIQTLEELRENWIVNQG